MASGRLRTEERCTEVEVHHRVPVIESDVDRWDRPPHPRIVNQDVNVAEVSRDPVEERPDARHVPQVGGVRSRRPAARRQLITQLLGRRIMATDGRDHHAAVDEMIDQSPTDAARGAGDDHRLTADIKIIHGTTLPQSPLGICTARRLFRGEGLPRITPRLSDRRCSDNCARPTSRAGASSSTTS